MRNRVKWWNLWGKQGGEKQPAASVSSSSKQAVIIFSFCCSQKYCVAMNLIILPRISIYCCNAMQQRYKHSVISAFLRVCLIFVVHSSHIQGLFLLKCDWVVSHFRAWHSATWGFTSQFPEVESNNAEETEARRLRLLRNIRRATLKRLYVTPKMEPETFYPENGRKYTPGSSSFSIAGKPGQQNLLFLPVEIPRSSFGNLGYK